MNDTLLLGNITTSASPKPKPTNRPKIANAFAKRVPSGMIYFSLVYCYLIFFVVIFVGVQNNSSKFIPKVSSFKSKAVVASASNSFKVLPITNSATTTIAPPTLSQAIGPPLFTQKPFGPPPNRAPNSFRSANRHPNPRFFNHSDGNDQNGRPKQRPTSSGNFKTSRLFDSESMKEIEEIES